MIYFNIVTKDLYVMFNSENLSDTEISDNEQTNTETISKKSKQSFSEYIEEFNKQFEEFIEEYQEFSNFKDEYKKKESEMNKTFSKMFKTVNHFTSKLEAKHKKDKKPRKQTENSGKSGFNKPQSIPPQFSKYLKLEDNVEMTRPQLLKLFNIKIQEDGFKDDGVITFSNKKIAKIFGVKEGYSFQAKDYHTFIAKYFNDMKKSNTNII